MSLMIHPRIRQRHPELCENDVAFAWENPVVRAVRVPRERELRIGFDKRGRELEMVGVILETGDTLVYHAMTPPSKKTRREVDRLKRGRYE